jgi:hypothetical protein
MRAVGREEAFFAGRVRIGGCITEVLMIRSLTALPFLEAARALVKEYEHLHGFKIRFETICLDKPSRRP